MKKILVVDDDALILHLYRQKFSDEGFGVETAVDGLAAIRALREHKPNLVILDLMMPRLSGVEVLKFIRSDATLKATPVLILTNCFMGDMVETAARLGVHGALLKAECKPQDLVELARGVLKGAPPMENLPVSRLPKPALLRPKPVTSAEPGAIVSSEFSDRAPDALAELRGVCQRFIRATDAAARSQHLGDLYRRARQVTAIAGFADHPMLSLFTGAFEALLFELSEKNATVGSSALRTVVSGVDFIGELFERIRDHSAVSPLSARIMTVDDDPLANRIVVEALRRIYLDCTGVEDPVAAFQSLERAKHDLVLLDIEMPGLNGFEFCKQLRKLPGYARTPVVYVTSHADFEHRAKSILSGGDDLIAKPVVPMELAVKVVILLLRSRMPQLAPR